MDYYGRTYVCMYSTRVLLMYTAGVHGCCRRVLLIVHARVDCVDCAAQETKSKAMFREGCAKTCQVYRGLLRDMVTMAPKILQAVRYCLLPLCGPLVLLTRALFPSAICTYWVAPSGWHKVWADVGKWRGVYTAHARLLGELGSRGNFAG